jgi:hypothetical protein
MRSCWPKVTETPTMSACQVTTVARMSASVIPNCMSLSRT